MNDTTDEPIFYWHEIPGNRFRVDVADFDEAAECAYCVPVYSAETVDRLRARVAELEAARQKSAAIDKLARSMIRDWGRRDEAGYRFPDTVPLIISTRDACVPDDLVRQILGWADEEA